jgi:hypothetical protein
LKVGSLAAIEARAFRAARFAVCFVTDAAMLPPQNS